MPKQCYIISFDVSDGGDRESLLAAIKSYGTWSRITESTFAVVTDESAKDLTEYLGAHIRDDDRLFVVRAGVEAAWTEIRCRPEWLKKHLTHG